MRTPALFAGLLFFAAFALYAFGAYPAFAPRDSADLALAALNLGVAHPPGYPLYSTLGKFWIELVPFGTPAYRLNILSAFCGAGAVCALFLFLNCRTSAVPALAAAAAFALSPFLRKFSGLEEMYSAQALFVALLLLAAAPDSAAGAGRSLSRPVPAARNRFGETSSFPAGAATRVKRAAFSGLLFGLGLVNHQSLILFLPTLFYLWSQELRTAAGARAFTIFFVLGLSLEFFLLVKLRSPMVAWDALIRAQYGTLTLSAFFSAPLTPELAARLLLHLGRGLWRQGPAAALIAMLGLCVTARRDRKWFRGLLFGFLAFGPLYFTATRFDLSQWVSRSVLEPDFIVPELFVCAFCGFGLEACRRWKPWLVVPLGLCAALSSLSVGVPISGHRRDFSAYDYARDLRREIPPGASAVLGGDTALFTMRYLERLEPGGRLLVSSQEKDLGKMIRGLMPRRPVYVTGFSQGKLSQMGLSGNPLHVKPRGLCQRVVGGSDRAEVPYPFQVFSILRLPKNFRADSYAHDIRLCYGFAHYLAGRLRERDDLEAASKQYVEAAAIDPGDYHVEWSPAKVYRTPQNFIDGVRHRSAPP